MIQIRLNGEPYALHEGSTLSQLVEARGLTGKRIAVEINRDIVPRSQHGVTTLVDGDVVEIVIAIGGGAR